MDSEADASTAAGAADTPVRIDKWLWAARLFKTRSLAQQAVDNGRVLVDGQRVKPSRALRIGDEIGLRIGDSPRVLRVRGLSDRRGPASVAQALYDETAESLAVRERRQQARRDAPEPASAIAGRPTKRDRRRLDRLGRPDGD